MLHTLRNPKLAPLWFVVRLLLGYVWIAAALNKFAAFPVYVGTQAGSAVAIYLRSAVAQSTGPHAQVTAAWAWLVHAFFLPTAGFWSVVVMFGELVVGVGLVLGLFTGTALLAAAVMNMVFMLSGTSALNPILLAVELALFAVGPGVARWGLDHGLFRDWTDAGVLFHPIPDQPQDRGTQQDGVGRHRRPPAHAA